ncbi:hypothetical protein CLU79DRAFT_751858 [Phycomyces nitens]|nr:hypothetical protein CLU79DRAFT_751858 [Phycomyces nitens]
MTTSWATSLDSHPIFNSHNANVFTPDIQAFDNSRQSRIAVLYDKYLIVAAERSIRILNLEKTDKKLAASFEYKNFSPYMVSFEIFQILPNSKLGIVVVAGEYEIAIIHLPKDIIDLEGDPGSASTHYVGSVEYYNGTNNVRILKLDWHPLSVTESHLMVLDSQNVLRMFDICKNYDKPEKSFDLSPLQSTTKNLVSDFNDTAKVTSFTTGGPSSDSNQWEPLTVYFTLDNGHIYALCPVLPNKSTIKARHWLRLIETTRARILVSQAQSGLNEVEYLSRHKMLSTQLYWLSCQCSYWKLLALIDQDLNILVDISFSVNQDNVVKQGPFVFKAPPHPAGTTDLAFVHSPAVNVLLVAHANSSVAIHILTKDIDAQWDCFIENISFDSVPLEHLEKIREYPRILPTTTVYETINFACAPGVGTSVQLIKDPLSIYKIYCQHSGGLDVISLNTWMCALQQLDDQYDANICREEVISQIESWPVEEYPTTVNRLFYSGNSKRCIPMIGAVITTKVGYSLIGYFWGHRCAVFPFAAAQSDLEHNDLPDVAALENHFQNININGDHNRVSQDCKPLFPLFKTPSDLLEGFEDYGSPIYIIPEEVDTNKPDNSLAHLTTNAAMLLGAIQKMNNAAAEIEKRILIQKSVHNKQKSAVEDLSAKFEAIVSVKAINAYRKGIEDSLKEYNRLVERTNTMLRSIADIHSPNATDEEVESFKRISALKSEVDELQDHKHEFKKVNMPSKFYGDNLMSL